jgi:hypothetical protein
MGGLPLHPLQSIGPIDTLMCEQIGVYFSNFQDAKRKVDAHVAEVGFSQGQALVDRFIAYVDDLPGKIVGHVDRVRPMIIELIAEVQNKAA